MKEKSGGGVATATRYQQAAKAQQCERAGLGDDDTLHCAVPVRGDPQIVDADAGTAAVAVGQETERSLGDPRGPALAHLPTDGFSRERGAISIGFD